MAVDLFQQIGLTQYEAEAYLALLREGPMTGYELGNRSKVPRPRAYDVLNRLCAHGLALSQPGDPARYRATEIGEVLSSTRRLFDDRLDRLARLLESLPTRDDDGEFWVARGRAAIANRCISMAESAERSLSIVSSAGETWLEDAARGARQRGIDVAVHHAGIPLILVLADGRDALLGSSSEDAQAIAGRNPALIELVSTYILALESGLPALHSPAQARPRSLDGAWLEWEKAKQRRLLHLHASDAA